MGKGARMPMPLESVGGIILCGGRSRRMGTSKAWLTCGPEHLLQRMVRIVTGVVRPVVVAGRTDQTLPPLPDDVLVVCDAVDNAGPLAGLAAGFEALAGRCEAAFVTSCDHPLLRPQFIERLIELLGDHSAAVPQYKTHLSPLSAVYRLETASIAHEMLDHGDLRMHDFANRCHAHVVPPSAFRDVDPGLDSLRNINDPDQYERIVSALDP